MNITTFQILCQTLLNGTIMLDVSSGCCHERNGIAQCETADLTKHSLQQCIQQLVDPDYFNRDVNDCFFNTSESQKPKTSVNGLNFFTCNETTEVQNLAKRKPASQSSTYTENGIICRACFAVDDNRNPKFNAYSCTHTKLSNYPLPHWWRVDLEQVVLVSYVVIYNRVDQSNTSNRLRDFAVQVGRMTQNRTEIYSECYFHAGPPTSPVVNINCSRPMCGRYVRIIKQPSDTLPLTLCEVEVYGTRAICMRENFDTYSLTMGTVNSTNYYRTTATETKTSSTSQETDTKTSSTSQETDTKTSSTSHETDTKTSSTSQETDTKTSSTSHETETKTSSTSQETDTKTSSTSQETDKVTDQWTHLQTQQVIVTGGGVDDMLSSGTETEQMTSVRDATSTITDHTVTTSGLSLPFTPAREVTNSLGSHTSTGEDNSRTFAMGTDLDHSRTSSMTMTMEKDDITTKMKRAISFSVISTISTKPAPVITSEQSMSDALRGPAQTSPISTVANDDNTQEVTMCSLYPQTSRSVVVVTSSSVWPVKGQCRCASNVHRNTSLYIALKMQAEKQAKILVENLSFNINATSRKLRKRHSMSDDRPTAYAMGFIAVTFLSLVSVVFIGNDMINAMKAVKLVVKPEGFITSP